MFDMHQLELMKPLHDLSSQIDFVSHSKNKRILTTMLKKYTRNQNTIKPIYMPTFVPSKKPKSNSTKARRPTAGKKDV